MYLVLLSMNNYFKNSKALNTRHSEYHAYLDMFTYLHPPSRLVKKLTSILYLVKITGVVVGGLLFVDWIRMGMRPTLWRQSTFLLIVRIMG